MSDAKAMDTPMHPSASIEKDEKGKSVSEKDYRGMIGSLWYLTASRPDIVSSQCYKQIFRYLVGTPNIGLWYKKGT